VKNKPQSFCLSICPAPLRPETQYWLRSLFSEHSQCAKCSFSETKTARFGCGGEHSSWIFSGVFSSLWLWLYFSFGAGRIGGAVIGGGRRTWIALNQTHLHEDVTSCAIYYDLLTTSPICTVTTFAQKALKLHRVCRVSGFTMLLSPCHQMGRRRG